MILRQFLHADPVGASDLFGCGGKAAGAVVDPIGDIAPYLRAAQETGLKLRFVVDTHIHADHVSCGPALAAAAGARYGLFAEAAAQGGFHRLGDGDSLDLGNVTAKVLHTPGHTPEHICLLVSDRTRAQEPWFVLTGQTLTVGDVGRTEPVASAEAGARQLFASRRRGKAPPDHLEVLPGALAGSVCGRGLSGKPMSAIGFERRHNEAFRIDDEDAFAALMLKDIPPAPARAAELRPVNAALAAA